MVSFTVNGKATGYAIIMVVLNALENAIGEKRLKIALQQLNILDVDRFND